MNCTVRPLAMLGFTGVTAIEESVAAVTVKVVSPDMLPDVAVMTAVPAATPVARPPGFTVATLIVPEAQVTDAVISTVVPLEYVPSAVNCLVRPATTLGFIGITVIKLKVAAVTLSVVFPDLLPDVAVITAVPAATPVARPPGFTVATLIVPEAQVTDAVISTEVPSE